jgi:hypothetical protein
VLDEETREVLQEVADTAGVIGDEAPVERFYYLREVGTLFDRCRGMFAAVLVLLDNGFVQEAAVFCRPLFVDSLALAEIAAADEKRRISLVVGRQLGAIADIEGIFREMQARGDDEVIKNLEHMAERRRKVEKYARRHGASTKHWDPENHVKTLADKHGRGDEYTSYRMTHHFVHGSAAITEHRSSVDDDYEVARIGGPYLDVEIWQKPTALFAAYSLALACRATCLIFGYDEPKMLEDLLRRIESIYGEADGAE